MKLFSKVSERIGNLHIDIRSSGIGIMITHHENKKIEIVYTKRFSSSVENNQMLKPEVLRDTLDKLLTDFVTNKMGEILSKNKIKIKSIDVNFAAPWYETSLKQIKFKKEEPIIFTKKIYDSLIQNEPLLNSEVQQDKKTIERNIVHVQLNDYELLDPFDKPAKDINIAFYVGRVDLKIVSDVIGVIKSHFSANDIELHTHAFIIYNTLRNLFINLSSFVFVDVSAEVTEIGIVRNNVLSTIVTLPHGKKELTENFAKASNMDYQNAISCLTMLVRGEFNDECTNKYSEILNTETSKWITDLKKVLGNVVGPTDCLPSKIFVLSDLDIQPVIASIFRSETIKKDFFQGKSGDVIEFSFKLFTDKLSLENEVTTDPLFTVSALSTGYMEKETLKI